MSRIGGEVSEEDDHISEHADYHSIVFISGKDKVVCCHPCEVDQLYILDERDLKSLWRSEDELGTQPQQQYGSAGCLQ